MAILLSNIQSLLARYGNERIEEQVNQKAPFLNMLDKVPVEGNVAIINIKEGFGHNGWIADQGNLPTGGSTLPEQLAVLPKFFIMRLAIPRGSTRVGSGKKDGINIVFQEVDSAAASSVRTMCRGLLKPNIETLSAAQATELGSDATTFTSADYTGYRVGNHYAVYDGGTPTTLNEIFRVVSIALDPDGNSHVITIDRNEQTTVGASATGYLSTAVTSDPLAANDTVWDMGNSPATSPANMSAGCDATTAVHGKSVSGEWQGNTAAANGGTLTVSDMRNVFTAASVRAGELPDFLLMNSRNRQRYSDLTLAQRRFHPGQRTDATGGVELDFEGRPIKIDENMPDSEIHYVNKGCVKKGTWFDFTDEQDGAGTGTSESGHALVSQSKYEYDHQRSAACNLLFYRRNGLGSLTGITS